MTIPGPAVAGSPVKTFGGTTAAVPVPAGVADLDIILCFVEKELAAAVTGLPSGFVEIGTAPVTTGNVTALHTFGKRANAADTGTYDFTWTGSAPYIEGVAIRVPGALAAGTAWEQPQGAARSSSGATTPAVALTTGGADRLIVWAGCNYNGGSWSGYPGGFTEVYDGGTTLAVATAGQAVQGATGSVTGTCSVAENECAALLAILPLADLIPLPPQRRARPNYRR